MKTINTSAPFTQDGYEVIAVIPTGAEVESHKIRARYERVYRTICRLAAAGHSFKIVTQISGDTMLVVAVDPTREGEIDMESITLPTFKDFVAEEVAKYLRIQQEKLVGDENPTFLLGQLITELEDGDWKRFEHVQPKGS